jgi:glycosyltransferase involved in cell wall biosynthesis
MPFLRWYVAGVAPMNKGLLESKGDWIAHLDDDDEFSPDHIESLLRVALDNNLEMVYGKVNSETQDGHWIELGSSPLECGNICRSAALYKGYLKSFSYDINSWKKAEPADFNLWRRMKRAGVRVGFANIIVGSHYKERTSIKGNIFNKKLKKPLNKSENNQAKCHEN